MKIRDILQACKEQGWRTEERNNITFAYPPDAEFHPIRLGSHLDGNSVGRHMNNIISQLRRAGLRLPGDESRNVGKNTNTDEEGKPDAMNTKPRTELELISQLGDEAQIEEMVEITRTRKVSIWTPTLIKMLRAYAIGTAGDAGPDTICEIELLIETNDPEKPRVLSIDDLRCVSVKTITIEQATSAPNRMGEGRSA